MNRDPTDVPHDDGQDEAAPHRENRTAWRIPEPERDSFVAERDLRERIKELNCLYGLARLAEQQSDSIDEMLQGVVELLPAAWQYPEITCAHIYFEGKTYTNTGFETTPWRQSSEICMHETVVGDVSVFYLEERPPALEGPFLREERFLLDTVAERIGAVALRIKAERDLQEANRQLTLERQTLQEVNIALRTVLSRIEDEKQSILKDIQTNVEKILLPIVDGLAAEVSDNQRNHVDLLRDNLEQIASPFIGHLSQKHTSMTPTEIGICNMIRNGLGTKEIARARGVSPTTISRHRERIRRKLGITNDRVNLRTYLVAFG